jgi:hypothetical protein
VTSIRGAVVDKARLGEERRWGMRWGGANNSQCWHAGGGVAVPTALPGRGEEPRVGRRNGGRERETGEGIRFQWLVCHVEWWACLYGDTCLATKLEC